MKLDITEHDQVLLTAALDQAIDSSKRQQNMKGKTKTMVEVYAQHERILTELKLKIQSVK